MDTKLCRGCTQHLPATLEYFNTDSRGRDGLHTRCKSCHIKSVKAWKERNKEKTKSHQETARSKRITNNLVRTEVDGIKICSNCKIEKEYSEFYLNRSASRGYDNLCKLCRRQYASKYKKSSFTINEEEYNLLLEKQDGGCAICGSSEKTLAIDHDHTSGEIRGLLCMAHNTALGKFNDDIALLERAIEYLRR